MLDSNALQRAELFFRTYLHTIMPLHASLVAGMCASAKPPLELATVLEDIGQRYIGLACELNETIIRRGRLDAEPDPDEGREAQIEAFLDRFVRGAGGITFADGRRLDAAVALAASPLVHDVIRAAILIAHAAPQTVRASPRRRGGSKASAEV